MSNTTSDREKILSRRVDAQLSARREAAKSNINHLRQLQANLNIAIDNAQRELQQINREIQEHEDSWARVES